MDRVEALVALNRALLRAYSRHTARQVRSALPIRAALPWLEKFLALNIAKEVQKDARVIRHAGRLHAAAGEWGDPMRDLLHAGREIDRGFLRNVTGMPVEIVIRYEEIEPIRRQRIDRLLASTRRILDHWPPAGGGRAALQRAYARTELEQTVHELMHLYALETRSLARSLRLPILLAPIRNRFGQALFDVMNAAAGSVARDASAAVYRRDSAGNRSP